MLTIFTYNERTGLEERRDPVDLRALIADRSRVTWVDIEKPTPPETELLDTVFNFHPLTIDDCLSPRHHPKVEDYGEYLFLITHEILPQSSEKEFKGAELDLFLGPHYLVTYHKPHLRSIETVKERSKISPKNYFRGADFLLAKILDEAANLYTPVLDQFERKIIEMEDDVLKEHDERFLTEVFGLRRNLIRLKGMVAQQLAIVIQLVKSGYDEMLPFSLPYLANVHDHMLRITDRVESHRDAVSGLVEAHLLTSSNKAGDVMKVLTMLSCVMLPMTVITGIYGMNFKYMPEINWPYGHYLAYGLMAAVGGGLLYYFRRKKWL